jgi:hypothetical protein
MASTKQLTNELFGLVSSNRRADHKSPNRLRGWRIGRVNQHVILVDPATSLLARVPSNAPLARQPLMSAASEGA